MSFRTIQAVLDNSPQPPSEKFLLMLIANSENEKTGQCNPSKTVLAFYHNTDLRNIRRRLNLLVDAGELVIYGQSGRSNHYIIPLYPNEPGFFDPGPCQETDAHRCNGHHGPLLNRTDLVMRDNPRWQAQESRKQELRESTGRSKRGGPQTPGRPGEGPQTPRGGSTDPQGRVHRPPGEGPQTPQNLKETENESEMNLGAAPSFANWIARPENWDARCLPMPSQQRDAYESWCADNRLEPLT